MSIDRSRWLSDRDAVFTQLMASPFINPVPVALAAYEGALDPDAMRHRCRLLQRLLPRIATRLTDTPWCTAPPRWVDRPGFDAGDALEVIDAPGDGTFDDLMRFAEVVGAQKMDPFGQVYRQMLVRGVDLDGTESTVMLTRMHHAVVDGVGGMRMARYYYDHTPDAPPPALPDAPPGEPVPGALELWRQGWQHEAVRARDAGRWVAERATWAATHPAAAVGRAGEWAAAAKRLQSSAGRTPLSPLFSSRSIEPAYRVIRLSMDDFKRGSRSLGGTVNDGFVTALAWALDDYHRARGHVGAEVRATVAMSTRADDDSTAGNEVTGLVMRLGLDGADLADRFAATQRTIAARRADRDTIRLAMHAPALLNRLPAALSRRVYEGNVQGMDLLCSNVMGIPTTVWMAGCKHRFTVSFPQRAGAAVGVIMTSWGDRAVIGLSADPTCVEAPDELAASLRTHLDEIASR